MYKCLGKSGLKVSSVCLGTMTFGAQTRPGKCTEEQAHKILNRFVDLGGNFLDTADVYCQGETEEVIGNWLKSIGSKRDELVIASKARFGTGREGPINGACLSRKHLLHEVDESLRRLQTDYIDLYQWHCYDATTPLEESLRTMDDLIRAGKIRYFGVSNLCGWQMQKMAEVCRSLNITACVSTQLQYSLLQRDIELELVDACCNENVGILAWSPLKGGWLTGKFKREAGAAPEGSRVSYSSKNGLTHLESHPSWEMFANNDQVWDLLDKMKKIADSHGKTVSQVALRWVLQKKGVVSVVAGCKTVAQLEDNMGAIGWTLSTSDMQELDAASQPSTVPYPYNIIRLYNEQVTGGVTF